jgi:hypothetical protein
MPLPVNIGVDVGNLSLIMISKKFVGLKKTIYLQAVSQPQIQ